MSSCHHLSSSTDLTGHHEKRRGKPVVVENLALRADKSEIETHGRGWSQVCRTKPHVADVCISWYLEEGDVCQADLVEEMRIRRLRVDGQHPAVLVTAKPRVWGGGDGVSANTDIFSFSFSWTFLRASKFPKIIRRWDTTYLITKGSSKSMLVPSPATPNTSWVTFSKTDHLKTPSCLISNWTWKASSKPSVAKITSSGFLLF